MGTGDEIPGRVFIGTSGWQYDDWVGDFYEAGRPSLEEYASRFATVEVNNTFYSLPDRHAVEEWVSAVGDRDFSFSVKASRYLTHMKKLKDPAEPLERLLDAVEPLGARMSVLLFQLPPHWRCNAERLRGLLERLPGRYRYAFEFRDPSWYTDEVYSLLEEHGAAFCIYHLDDHRSPSIVTADHVYVRLHGSEGKYRGSYDASDLAGWAGAISSWNRAGKDVFVYFDNDQGAAAPRDAARLLEMVG